MMMGELGCWRRRLELGLKGDAGAILKGSVHLGKHGPGSEFCLLAYFKQGVCLIQFMHFGRLKTLMLGKVLVGGKGG